MREKNRLKEMIRSGQIPLGMEYVSGSLRILEIIGWAGFDFVQLDMEHSCFDFSDIEMQVRTAEGVGLAPVVRVMENTDANILRVLETGAASIVIPQVRSAEEVRSALEATRYAPAGNSDAPAGRRGMCPVTRAARFCEEEWEDYIRWVEEEILLIPLIENEEALNDVEAICSVPGIDVIGFGSGDLGQCLGAGARGLADPVVQEAFHHVLDVAKRTNTVLSAMPHITTGDTPEDTLRTIQELIDLGAGKIMYDADALMFTRACRGIVDGCRPVLDRAARPVADSAIVS